MDSEEFYDSLEDSEYEGLETSFQEHYTGNNKNADKATDFTIDDNMIPFYDRKLSKSQMELCKKTSKSSTIVNKGNSGSKPRHRKRNILTTMVWEKKMSSKSYLDLFYSRIGTENTEAISSRATCLDLSPRSYRTCGSGDDLESVYYRNENNSNSSYASTTQDSMTSLMSNLQSVSEHAINNEDAQSKKKSSNKVPVNKVAELGRLGPDIPLDKLELYHKRQQYGKKASQTNLIKMMERKTLKKLQREIENSKIYT